MRNTFVNELHAIAARNKDIFLISGDAGFMVLDDFHKDYPDRFVNCGIAEQSTTGYAAGLAMMGLNVFVYNIIPFLLYRCYEQVRNDICYQKLPVTLVGIGSGITYAPQGMTHYSVEDLAVCRSLPNLTVISPADPAEVVAATRYAAEAQGPVYIRIAKTGDPTLRTDAAIDILAPAVVREGADVVVLAHGSIVAEACEAWDACNAQGMPFRLVSVPTVQPLPAEGVLDATAGFSSVIVLEEHFRSGGLADRVGGLFLERGIRTPLRSLSIPDAHIHSIKGRTAMRTHFGLDKTSIANAVARAAQGAS